MLKNKALISTIQSYATKDGPGIRSTVFFMGCNLKCVWCSNPELMDKSIKQMYFKERCQKQHQDMRECKTSCPETIETVGYYISVDELFNKLMRDNVFYDISGGGVTLSGGDPVMHYHFILELAERLKNAGIHIALDTAGYTSSEHMSELALAVDMILFDIKAYDSEIHLRCTGVNNAKILSNAQLIAEMNRDMIIRLIIVPGYNDDLNDIYQRLDFVKGLGQSVKRIDVLKYHNLGAGKYQRLGLIYPLHQIPEIGNDLIEKVSCYAKQLGLTINIE